MTKETSTSSKCDQIITSPVDDNISSVEVSIKWTLTKNFCSTLLRVQGKKLGILQAKMQFENLSITNGLI